MRHPFKYLLIVLAFLQGFYFVACTSQNKTKDNEEGFDTDQTELSDEERIEAFWEHYNNGINYLNGNPVRGIEQDHCKAFVEFEQAIRCEIDIEDNPYLLYLYKESLYLHAALLSDSYYNLIPACTGGGQLDRCIEDLDQLVNIKQRGSDINTYDTLALVLLGDCYYQKEDYVKATECYEKSGITPDQLDIGKIGRFYVSYDKQGLIEREHAISLAEALFESLRTNPDYYRIITKNNPVFNDTLAREIMWYYISKDEHEKALDFWFKIKNNFSYDYFLLFDQAWSHINLGDFSAISDLAFSLNMMNRNGIKYNSLSSKSNNNSNEDEDIFKIINSFLFDLASGFCYIEGSYATVIDYYVQDSLALDTSTDAKNMLAICYQKLAEELDEPEKTNIRNLAMDYFHEIIVSEESTGQFSSAPYAYYYLGEPNKAVEAMEQILQTIIVSSTLTEDDSIYYYHTHIEAAEIYAMVGELKKAEEHLKKALEYYHYPILLARNEKAPLLAPIQDFVKREVNRYKKDLGIAESPIVKDTIVCDIPFKRREPGYTKEITCIINGETVQNMVVDYGADYIQLTQGIADTLLHMTAVDSIGQATYDLANGDKVYKKLVLLKEVKIGNIALENVQAIIEENPKAPLLLGCTVLNNLIVETPSPINKGMIRMAYIKESIVLPENK